MQNVSEESAEHRRIGTVIEVSFGSAVVILTTSSNESEPSEYAAGQAQVGSYLLIESGPQGTFAQITSVCVLGPQHPYSGQIAATVELVGSVELGTGAVSSKMKSYPRVGSSAYSAPEMLTDDIVSSKFNLDKSSGQRIQLELATVSHNGNPLLVCPEKLFGRHCAVVGSSGGGKSWTLARIVEQAALTNSKVILFDSSGEFHTMGGNVKHVHIGRDPEPAENSISVSIPYSQLTESDLFAIFRPSGASQAPKLRAAMKSLKLALLEPQIALNGVIMKADRSKLEFERAYMHHLGEVESPYANFDIHYLARQIENECVNHQRSPTETSVWGGINGQDLSLCVPLLNRIQDIIKSPELATLFEPDVYPSLFNEIESFLEDPLYSVLCVSLKYLSFEHNTREIAMNAVGRNLLEMARLEKFRARPLLVVLDEAHQFLNRGFKDLDVNYPLDAFGLIAKQGRKHCLTLCIATQRPRDIPEDVFSQMGTMVVHRLINDHDRSVVERASGAIDKNTSLHLPALGAGEAVLIGVDFPVPLPVRIKEPRFKPDSKGPDYQKFWL